MKFLNPRIHGYIDYLAIVLLALAPTLFGFAGIAAAICYIVAVAYLGMCLATAYPLGLAKLIPFTFHGGVELALSIGFVVAPWLFGFSAIDAARNFFIVAGIALLGVYLVTDYRAAEAYRQGPPIHREAHPRT